MLLHEIKIKRWSGDLLLVDRIQSSRQRLDLAQREGCCASVQSQRAAGWIRLQSVVVNMHSRMRVKIF